jgi:hypothetical protein
MLSINEMELEIPDFDPLEHMEMTPKEQSNYTELKRLEALSWFKEVTKLSTG